MTTSDLVTRLRDRGFALSADDGSLRVSPASALTPDDRAAIRLNLAGLIAALTPVEPWNLEEARHLMDQADSLVERLGAPGSHPDDPGTAGRRPLRR